MLEAARVCRFCGYRFAPEPRRAQRSSSPSNPIMALLRGGQQSTARTIPELLEDWDVRLRPGEAVGDDGLCMAELEDVLGFALVSNTRLRFITAPRTGSSEVKLDRALEDITGAEQVRRRMRRAVVVRWRDGTESLLRSEGVQQEQLIALLSRGIRDRTGA